MSAPPPRRQAPARRKVAFGKPKKTAGHRVILYGPGGIGKTTLVSHAPGPVVWFDLDDSLARLPDMKESSVVAVDSWSAITDALEADGWDGVGTIVIDSITKAEELAVEHTLQYVPHEKGHKCLNLDDYGFGKGLTHNFTTFIKLFDILDKHAHAGRNVVLIAHDCTSSVPNPAGEDWLRFEPRLQSPASGKSSIRLRSREWADHLLFLGYDVVSKDGKGRGSGTRTVYPSELPHCMAKSRTCQSPLPLNEPSELWTEILK